MHGAQVRSLVRELRPHVFCGTAKKKLFNNFKKKKKEKASVYQRLHRILSFPIINNSKGKIMITALFKGFENIRIKPLYPKFPVLLFQRSGCPRRFKGNCKTSYEINQN